MDSKDYMKLVLDAASKGHSTWTNPKVGAVIVKNNQILAIGHHEKFGENHAEINALSKLSKLTDAKGATLYVTLEPCSHFGKTPPCVEKIVQAGIKKVVIGQIDPNPIVSGFGVDYLKEHNVNVEINDIYPKFNRSYNFFYKNNRPLITIKYAMTLDGKINHIRNNRSILTESAAYMDSQKLRSQNQAILIGENTFKIDDPELTVRLNNMKFSPIRLILIKDINQVDLSEKIFKVNSEIWFLSKTKPKKDFSKNVSIFVDDWTPNKILKLLTEHSIQSLLIEGGSSLQANFISSNLVDNFVVYIAPKIFGGQGLPAIFGEELSKIMNLKNLQVKNLKPDLKITAERDTNVHRNN
ncbi:bifunctional diaminohydroxyphosphoribosylaminopyrimidine deaminase/5-amino-6-(5-phosphoribosylamino)uracil reductase RibD [Companilactobacillus keshanensis]|uniref:Riboflavin biosynthesis protein RibD n=1 Tax=Companilactobacillus keshanensis TaxID=2486003 RepID=A0ABW4BTS1_9LACO|nr:bifunctional diaminohydroxyphosphoribosylaminopyrimidine deaminase/5-amino-6-(5-phosphoribosylamino)uracil reductase RibD [Companilactobacillus keshanensis]